MRAGVPEGDAAAEGKTWDESEDGKFHSQLICLLWDLFRMNGSSSEHPSVGGDFLLLLRRPARHRVIGLLLASRELRMKNIRRKLEGVERVHGKESFLVACFSSASQSCSVWVPRLFWLSHFLWVKGSILDVQLLVLKELRYLTELLIISEESSSFSTGWN